MSTEPSTLERITELIYQTGHGTPGAKKAARKILESNIVTNRADLPEVTVGSDTYLHADQWWRCPNEDPKHIRRTAIALLAIAAHIESAQSAESVAAEKLTKRRDELAREFWHQQGVDQYGQLAAGAQLAVDHIIGLESPA